MEQKKKRSRPCEIKTFEQLIQNEEFRFIDGILCRKNFDPDGKLWLPVIPKHLRADILRHFHDAPTAGHLGFAKTYDRISQEILLAGNVPKCRSVCHALSGVPKEKIRSSTTTWTFSSHPSSYSPFHRIEIDLLGRFPKSAHGNKWIIVCTDYSTRYAITKALPTAEVDEIAKFLLEEIVLRHGAPRVIITDRGAVFRSRLVSSLVDLCNIDHRFTTAYHPQTNGLTERFNKTLADMLSMYVDVEQKNWDEILPFVTFAYNTAKQETTAARAEESRQLARVHTLRAQDKDRRRYDSKHTKWYPTLPGDLVWVYTPVRKVGLSEKLFKKTYPAGKYPKNLGISQSVISRLWQRFQDDSNVSRCYSTGSPRVTKLNEDRYLQLLPKRNRRSTASDLSRQLSSATGTTVSRQTVYRRLGHIGLYARRPYPYMITYEP
ncbi:retrovirus-related Pol polyprotein from transposon 412 [Trichonephila clavipes]|nr:retrovirus-related Pol polyprotein from transposon 412 [Trichonephila clavipes]